MTQLYQNNCEKIVKRYFLGSILNPNYVYYYNRSKKMIIVLYFSVKYNSSSGEIKNFIRVWHNDKNQSAIFGFYFMPDECRTGHGQYLTFKNMIDFIYQHDLGYMCG